MTITFLGTGPSTGIPRKGCRCRVCRKGGKSKRMRSSALVTHNRANVLIDAGPDVKAQLQREGVKRIDAVLLTHAHEDASGGMKKLERWASEHQDGHSITVYAEQRTINIIKKRWKTPFPFIFRTVKPLSRIRAGGILVTPFRVSHSMTPGFPTLGFKIGSRFVYASDVSDIPNASKNLIRGIHTLVLDGAMYFKHSIKSHLTVNESIRTASSLNVPNLILTQISHTYPPHEQAKRAIKSYLASQHALYPKTVKLAYDGMKIRLK